MVDQIRYKKIILASGSPRRHYLLKQIGVEFEILKGNVNEDYPESLAPEEIAIFLSEKKSMHFADAITDADTLLITADTIVLLDEKILGKPSDYDEATRMLRLLSGKKHTVITGVSLRNSQRVHTFTSFTDVYFKPLSDTEISYYLDHYKPYDKAGSYGIQEWIGYIGIERIEGSYFNVMGLPIQKLYEELIKF